MSDKKRIDLHISLDMYKKLKNLAVNKDMTITTALKLILQSYFDAAEGDSKNGKNF